MDLEFLENEMILEAIDCPGDTISYNCSIKSNTEDLHLLWTVEFPDTVWSTIEMIYDSLMNLGDVNLLDMDVSTTLLEIKEGFIQSSITLTVLNDSMNGTTVKCSIADLDSVVVTILINTSSKPIAIVQFYNVDSLKLGLFVLQLLFHQSGHLPNQVLGVPL